MRCALRGNGTRLEGVRLSFLKECHLLLDLRHELVAHRTLLGRGRPLADSPRFHLRGGRSGDPALETVTNVCEKGSLLRIGRNENGEIAAVIGEGGQRGLVGIRVRFIAREHVTALFFFHLQDGALQLRHEIQNLRGLHGPFLIPHPLILHDLFFVLQRGQNLAGILQDRAPQLRHGAGIAAHGAVGSKAQIHAGRLRLARYSTVPAAASRASAARGSPQSNR